MKWIALSLLMLCVGCAARGHLPSPIDSVPNVLTNDTKVVVLADSTGAIPRGTVVETQAEDQPLIEVALKEDTIVVVAEDKKEVQLPKNTKVILPPNTPLVMQVDSPIKLDQSTDIVLSKGTVVTMSKVNWYAILFYAGLAIAAASYYFSLRKTNHV